METVGVETPERGEGPGINPQNTIQITTAGSPGTPAGARQRFVGLQIPAQGREFGPDAEAVVDKPVARLRSNGSSSDGPEPLMQEPIPQGGQYWGCESRSGGDRGEVRHIMLALPGPDAKSRRTDPY